MAFILFAQTMFGNLIAIRILRKFRDRSLISTTCLAKIGTAFAAIMCFVAFLQPLSPRLWFLFVIFAVLALKFFLAALENRRIEFLLEHFPRFVDHWLLNLRVGMSHSIARDSALNAADETFRVLMRPLFTSAGSEIWRRGHLFLTPPLITELKSIQKQSHNTVARLQTMRDSLARESDFRRKSGQALRQATIQAAVMVVLQIALCFFVAARSGWARNADLIMISALMCASGVLILRLMARRIRWTI